MGWELFFESGGSKAVYRKITTTLDTDKYVQEPASCNNARRPFVGLGEGETHRSSLPCIAMGAGGKVILALYYTFLSFCCGRGERGRSILVCLRCVYGFVFLRSIYSALRDWNLSMPEKC
jgi:hypothetical protein